MAEVRVWLERLGENRARAYRILVYEQIKALLIVELFHGLLTRPLYCDSDVPLSDGPFSALVGQDFWQTCHAWEIHFKVTFGGTSSAAMFLRPATPPACSEGWLEVQLLGAAPADWIEAMRDRVAHPSPQLSLGTRDDLRDDQASDDDFAEQAMSDDELDYHYEGRGPHYYVGRGQRPVADGL